jgi:plastocyanin
MRPTLPAIAACALLLAPASARAAEPGWIEGTVRLGNDLVDRHSRFTLYADPTRPAHPRGTPSLAEELENVVVYLEEVPAGATPPAARPASHVMRQEGMEFVPHVLPVVQGETVDFLNADPLFHNVFSLSKASSFDLGRYPSGKTRSVRFAEPGVVKVFCHIHSDMSAVVLVLANAFYASPSREGRYALAGVPPGTYRLTAWHARARPIHRTIRVESGRATVSDFEIPLTEGEN